MREADGEDLVWTNGGVPALAINHIVKTTGLRIPEQFIKTRPRQLCAVSVLSLPLRLAKLCSQLFHDAQGVVPERLNLYGQSPSRRHDPIANLRVHPGH